MEDIKVKIRAFLAQYVQNHQLQDDDDIFAMGFVNSMFAMQLVLFVEQEFSLSIENADLDFDNFRSVNALANLVIQKNTEKRTEKSPAASYAS